MSDLENSDDDTEILKKNLDEEYGEVEDSKNQTSSKKIISGYTDDTDDEEIGEEEDDEDEEDFIGLKDDEIQMKSILSKEKMSTSKQDSEPYDLEVDNLSPINSDVDSDYDEELQKFEYDLNNDYVKKNHPECLYLNNNEIEALSQITRDDNGIIIDNNHKTLPILTKYEKTKILGQRAKQINNGDKPYVNIPENVIDGYIIAEMELKQKKIPFIIRRPLANGNSEYWKLSDLEQI